MAIIQQPDVLSLSGNIKDFRISSTEIVSFVLKKGDNEILSQIYEPNKDNIIVISVKDIINSSLEFEFRNLSLIYEQTNISAQFTALIDNLEVTFVAIRAGVDNFADTAANFLTHNFLTWQPNLKQVTYYTPEFLTYYAVQNSIFKVKLNFLDTTGEDVFNETVNYGSLQAGKAYTIPLQYALIKALTNNQFQLAYYDVWVESASGEQLTYVQRYVADGLKSEQESWVLFENSLGGIDTFRAYGATNFNGDHTHNIAEVDDVSFEYEIDTDRQFQKNTGHLNAKERRWLLDFFPSKAKYIYSENAVRRVVVTESNVSYTDKELPSNYTFTYQLAESNIYLNIPRSDYFGDLNITLPDASFSIPPRIVEFPRISVSEGALFPVQDPYSNQWGAATGGSLAAYIAARLGHDYEGDGGVGHSHSNIDLLQLLSYAAEYLLVGDRKIKAGYADIAGEVSGDRYLRKDIPDTAQGLITFLQGLTSEELATLKKGLEVKGKADIIGNLDVTNAATAKTVTATESVTAKNATVAETATTLNAVIQALATTYNLTVQHTADIMHGIIRDYLSSETFVSGFLGSGFRIWQDEGGNWCGEFDKLTVRKTFTVFELIVQKVTHQGGMVIRSAAGGKLVAVTDGGTYWRCEHDSTDDFVIDDQVLCQTYTGISLKRYWRKVTSSGAGFFNLSKTDCEAGSSAPEVGDDVAVLGNRTNTDRQAAQIDCAVGVDAPYRDDYSGIDSYSLVGKLVTRTGSLSGIVDEDFGALNGFGLYTKNIVAKGTFLLKNGKTVETAISEAEAQLQTNINAAQQAVNNAQAAATSAQASANAAQTTANTATTNAATANSLLSDIANDNKLTPAEKQDAKKEWDIIVGEKPKNDASASGFGVDKTAYTAAYTALSSYLAPLLSDLTTTSDIVGDTFRATFKSYYDARTDLLNAVSTAAKKLADDAQTSADNAQSTVDKLQIGGRNLRTGNKYRAEKKFKNYTSVLTWDILDDYVGKEAVISFDAKADDATTLFVYHYQVSGLSISMSVSKAIGTEYKRYSYVGTVVRKPIPPGQSKGEIGFYNGTYKGNFYIKNVKIEIGNKPTDWSPAPEDIENRVTTVETNFEIREGQISSKVTEVTTKATEAASSASEAAGSATSAQGSSNSASGSATNAANSASEAAGSATSAQNAANSAGTILEEVTAKESSIIQTAGQISQKVTEVNTKVVEANTAASNAKKSETNASGSATNAANSASGASGSATNAGNSANAAAGSASAAGNSAKDAATQAANANVAAADAAAKLTIITEKESSINQTASQITLKVTEVNTKSAEVAANAINAANSAELAMAMSKGKMLYRDATFIVNSTFLYAYLGGSSVTRIELDDSPNSSKKAVKVKGVRLNAPTDARFSGFYFVANRTRANASFVARFIAKIPEGYTVKDAHNPYGTGGSAKWLTSRLGTGKWTEYALRVNCGASGTFSNINCFCLTANQGYPTPTEAAPIEWHLAYATVFDITDAEIDYIADAAAKYTTKTVYESGINVLKDQIALKVSQTDFNALGQRVGSAETSIVQQAVQIAAKAEKTTVDSLGTRVSAAEAKITPEAINLTVKSQIAGAVDKLQIGGRNLRTGNKYRAEKKFKNYTSVLTWDILDDYIGKEAVISFDAKADDATTFLVYHYQGSGLSISMSVNKAIGTEYKRYSQVGTVVRKPIPSEHSKGEIGFYNGTYKGNFYIKNVKIEIGNKPTDWSPAPEDLIAEAAADAAAKYATIANLQVAQGSITANVASINALTGRMSSAELALHSDNIWLGIKSNVKTEIDGVKVGGRNLIRNSGNFINTDRWGAVGLGTVAMYVSNKLLHCMVESGVPGSDLFLWGHLTAEINKAAMTIGREYTVSMRFQVERATEGLVGFRDAAGVFFHTHVFQSNVGWNEVSYTFTYTASTITAFVFQFDRVSLEVDSFVEIDYVKLEEGNKKTGWSPAPEDTEDYVKAGINISNGQVDIFGKLVLDAELIAKLIKATGVEIRDNSGNTVAGMCSDNGLLFYGNPQSGDKHKAKYRQYEDGTMAIGQWDGSRVVIRPTDSNGLPSVNIYNGSNVLVAQFDGETITDYNTIFGSGLMSINSSYNLATNILAEHGEQRLTQHLQTFTVNSGGIMNFQMLPIYFSATWTDCVVAALLLDDRVIATKKFINYNYYDGQSWSTTLDLFADDRNISKGTHTLKLQVWIGNAVLGKPTGTVMAYASCNLANKLIATFNAESYINRIYGNGMAFGSRSNMFHQVFNHPTDGLMIRSMSGNYGHSVDKSGIKMTWNGGLTWYTVTRQADGTLKAI